MVADTGGTGGAGAGAGVSAGGVGGAACGVACSAEGPSCGCCGAFSKPSEAMLITGPGMGQPALTGAGANRILRTLAEVAELADAPDSKSGEAQPLVRVRLPPSAPNPFSAAMVPGEAWNHSIPSCVGHHSTRIQSGKLYRATIPRSIVPAERREESQQGLQAAEQGYLVGGFCPRSLLTSSASCSGT